MNDLIASVLSQATDLTTIDIALRLGFGALIGICLGMTGVGGGVLIIPILQVVFKMNPVLAVGTASMIATLVKVGAAATHVKAKNVSWRESGILLAGAIPVVYLASSYTVELSNNPTYKAAMQQFVQYFIIAVMVFALITLVLKMRAAKKAEEQAVVATNGKYAKGVGLGVVCGTVLGFTGIGGGVMILPALNGALQVPIKKAVGSSIIIALVLSGLAALSYSHGGQADVTTAVLLACGAYVGVPIAMKLVKQFSDNTIYALTISILSISLLLTICK